MVTSAYNKRTLSGQHTIPYKCSQKEGRKEGNNLFVVDKKETVGS